MPLEYLRMVSEKSLPLEVTNESDIDKLRVLAAADMIEAKLPETGSAGTAVVLRITGYGRAALAAGPPHGVPRSLAV